MFILFGGAAAAIRAIYRYEGKASSSLTEVTLNKNE